MGRFRNGYYVSLHIPTQNYLSRGLAVLFADFHKQRFFKHSASAFAERRPCFVLHAVFFHPFVRFDLLIVRVRFHLIYHRLDTRETADIDESVGIEVAHADCFDNAFRV